jgi:hypothetical protein
MAPRDDVLSHTIREIVLFGSPLMFWNGSTMTVPLHHGNRDVTEVRSI